MEVDRPKLKTVDGDGALNLKHLSSLLDTLVAMCWDLKNELKVGAQIPTSVTASLRRVDDDLAASIETLKALIYDHGLPMLLPESQLDESAASAEAGVSDLRRQAKAT